MTQVEVIVTIATALGIRELIPLLFNALFKRKEEVQRTLITNEIDTDKGNREQIVFLRKQLAEAYAEIDKAQDIINELRDRCLDLSKKLHVLELEKYKIETALENMKLTACFDKNCPERVLESDKNKIKK